MTDPARSFLWLVLILSAPWALVLLVAFLRGYDVHVHLARRRRDDDR